MAIFHCSIKIISRGKGKSAVAAAYRSGETLTNHYDGVTHDFTRKGGIVHTEILLPPHAPPDFADRSTLWNSVEKIEKAKNSQLAREIEIALPVELDREQQIQLVREYVKENFVSVGMCADFAIHDKQDGNPHAHIMLTMRPLEQSGEWGAKSKKEYLLDKDGQRIKLKNGTFKNRKVDTVDWNSQEKAEVWRQAWADIANRYLAAQNRTERIDHRSYKRQGIEQIPTVHMGVAATQMERRGIVTDKGNQNREIREQNRLLKEVKRRIAALTAWIKEKASQAKENQSVNPFPSVPIPSERTEQPPTLLELLNRAYAEAAKPQSRYGKIQDLKLYAKAFNFLQSRNITTLVQLQEVVSDMKKQYWTTNREIKQTEKLLHERKELIDQAGKYQEHRPIYKAYIQTKPKKQEEFFESNRAALILYQSAERYLKEHLGKEKVLKLKAWKAEIADLTQKKSRLYSSLQTLKAEVQEAEAVKKCVEQAIQPEQTKSKTQSRRRG
ncbi:MobQ family relaxase [Enterocloster clostridioformis]|uniref:MobQ family relaxase n=1 Tax=Enterocloster clostridioformis TaxID=1531 RepID=UPI0026753042|nr:MobQ family relaxase [Enterocloster clostridioformis]